MTYRYSKPFTPAKEWQDKGATHGYEVYDGAGCCFLGNVLRIYDGTRADGWWIAHAAPGEQYRTRRQAADAVAKRSGVSAHER